MGTSDNAHNQTTLLAVVPQRQQDATSFLAVLALVYLTTNANTQYIPYFVLRAGLKHFRLHAHTHIHTYVILIERHSSRLTSNNFFHLEKKTSRCEISEKHHHLLVMMRNCAFGPECKVSSTFGYRTKDGRSFIKLN